MSRFIEQPGDRALRGVKGYPLDGYVPCTLKPTNIKEVIWYEVCDGNGTKFARNHSLADLHTYKYDFKKSSNEWDYSLMVNNLSCLHLACCVLYPNGTTTHSSWSNITAICRYAESTMSCLSVTVVPVDYKLNYNMLSPTKICSNCFRFASTVYSI